MVRPVVPFMLLLLVPLARAENPPRPPLPTLVELPGPLVIAGGGTVPDDVREALFDLAGKEKARVVVISVTPAEADTLLKPWRALKPASVVVLRAGDRKAADDPAVAKPLADATGVWLDGDPAKIVAAYGGTGIEKELRKLHTRGAVIGGTGDAFGFQPGFVVEPHFTSAGSKRLHAAVATLPGSVGLGIADGTAVTARGRLLRVVGDGTVTICIGKGGGRSEATQEAKKDSVLDVFQLRRAAANRAAKEPFPPAKPRDPVVEKGTLLIVGGGSAGPEIWKKFIDLAGGPDALIVMIPTAQDDPLALRHPEVAAIAKHGEKNVRVLHTRDRKEADDPKFSAVLAKATGVWFGGGRQWRFVDAYEGTLAEKRIHDVLARGGVIGGSSAGASIQSEYMPRGHPLGNTVMAAEGYERGFGFLPGCAVDQHFFARRRTADMTGLMAHYPQFLGIGIDEGTAIVVTGSKAEVIGKSKVGFYDTRKKPAGGLDYEEVKTGGAYDLKKRAPVE